MCVAHYALLCATCRRLFVTVSLVAVRSHVSVVLRQGCKMEVCRCKTEYTRRLHNAIAALQPCFLCKVQYRKSKGNEMRVLYAAARLMLGASLSAPASCHTLIEA